MPRSNARLNFWDKLEPASNGCMLWPGPFNKDGYGKTSRGGKTITAHRLAWELTSGEVPSGLCVCHSCDVPACCNPGHLWLGTVAENNHDRHAKGRDATGDRSGPRVHPERLERGPDHWAHRMPERRVRGERNGRALITADDVRAIRRDHKAGVSARDLAARFGVTHYTIWDITGGRTWRHVEAA